MNNSKSKYRVDGQQLDEYLKKRFISVAITFSIILIIVFSMFSYIMYKHQAPEGLWSLLILVPIMTGAFLYGVKRWNSELRELSGTEFFLSNNCLVQKTPNQVEKDFEFLKIVVMDKKKFGTIIIKGNWLTRIDYYRPKISSYEIEDPNLIFIPTITTNYLELIDMIKQARRHT